MLKNILLYSFLLCIPLFSFTADWEKFDMIAKSQVGVKYKFGGDTPQKGFDCSGLVEYVYAKIGTKLPRGTNHLKNMGKKIEVKNIRPGDLIFFKPEGSVSHVGLYLGEGVMIHAPSSGKKVTVLEVFRHQYWSKKIAYVRRIVGDTYFTNV